MADYDKYYKTEDLFGEAYSELVEFFRIYEPKGTLIDLGCGQGRDCLPLARIGYQVTGIDSSQVGIDQMLKRSDLEDLNITGIVGDIYAFDSFHEFDIVLLDSMFHFEKGDLKMETDLIGKIANRIKPGSLICFCIQDTGRKVEILKDTIIHTGLDFEVINDSRLIYQYEDKESGHRSETKYGMYIVEKISDMA